MQELLQASGLTRRFGSTIALDHVNFLARAGEIHALLGENGAGKTTLMNVIAGHLRPDRGRVMLDGTPLRTGSVQAALQAGIATVHQSPMLFERLSVMENLALGGSGARRLGRQEVAARADAIARRLGFSLRLRERTLSGLSIAERVRLEILRALSFDPRVLLLDEPTGLLGPDEVAGFMDLLRSLRDRGRAVVLITHKLGEAMAVADRITMLRRGRVVAETVPAQTSTQALAMLMVGEFAPLPAGLQAVRDVPTEVLTIDRLGIDSGGRSVLDGICLHLNAGEIFGIAGVDGNGQHELMEVLACGRRPTRGEIRVRGKAVDDDGANSIAVIPQNRDQDGLILDMELWENLLLEGAVRRAMRRHGLQDRRGLMALGRELIARFGIKARGPRQKVFELSGGHRQRLMVARALACRPAVLAAHDLTRGLDIAATAEIHRMVRNFTAQGGAAVLISTDLDEILGLCDRMAVISRGHLIEVNEDQRSPQRLGLLMAGADR